jgi:hypothetical protein
LELVGTVGGEDGEEFAYALEEVRFCHVEVYTCGGVRVLLGVDFVEGICSGKASVRERDRDSSLSSIPQKRNYLLVAVVGSMDG